MYVVSSTELHSAMLILDFGSALELPIQWFRLEQVSTEHIFDVTIELLGCEAQISISTTVKIWPILGEEKVFAAGRKIYEVSS